MAADGSRWQFLKRTPSRLAPRDAIDSDDQDVESSRSADSRRAIAHESGSRIGFPTSHQQ
jgi:hypothetical protein